MDLTSFTLASGDATIFYIVGGALALLAVVFSAIGVKAPDFPQNPRMAGGVIAHFLVFVTGSAAYAVLSAREEQAERREHLAEAEKGDHGESKAGEGADPELEGATDPETGEIVELGADPEGQLAFDETKLKADSGAVTIELTNPAAVPHDVIIASDGEDLAESELISDGGTTTATADLDPGSYTYYCSVPGHREAGMEGTLEVK